MKIQELRALLLEDDIFKAQDIKKALNNCGVRDILQAENQRKGLELLEESTSQGKPISLIVTDMSYPLDRGAAEDPDAGEKLVKYLQKENLDIPVILCSSINYKDPMFAGCVWYNKKLRDIDQEFREILAELK